MKISVFSAGLLSLLAITSASAQELSVKVTNLTNGMYFTPLLVAAHSDNIDLFEAGMPATTNLQAMAEGGNIRGLVNDVANAGADYVANPAAGRLAPGASTVAVINTSKKRNNRLSVVAMLIPTNDAFVGADSLEIPNESGTYVYYLNAYDSGTEANDEIVNGAGTPGSPGSPPDPGNHADRGATGVTNVVFNRTVHIHPGIIGDMNPTGGISDLNPIVHRWLNPVAKLEVVVKKDER